MWAFSKKKDLKETLPLLNKKNASGTCSRRGRRKPSKYKSRPRGKADVYDLF